GRVRAAIVELEMEAAARLGVTVDGVWPEVRRAIVAPEADAEVANEDAGSAAPPTEAVLQQFFLVALFTREDVACRTSTLGPSHSKELVERGLRGRLARKRFHEEPDFLVRVGIEKRTAERQPVVLWSALRLFAHVMAAGAESMD